MLGFIKRISRKNLMETKDKLFLPLKTPKNILYCYIRLIFIYLIQSQLNYPMPTLTIILTLEGVNKVGMNKS
jgi:hypothetical protein